MENIIQKRKLLAQLALSMALLLAMIFLITRIVEGAALNPGHAWNTLDDAALPIANGGTAQTTANAAFNALAPSQGGNSGKFLTTDASNTSWATLTRNRSTTTREILSGRSSAGLPASAYCNLSGAVCAATSEASLGAVMPVKGTIRNLYVYTSASQTSTDSCTTYVRKTTGACTNAFSNTALTCNIASAQVNTCSDTTNRVSVAAGDCLQIFYQEVAGTCTGNVSW